MPQLTLEDRVIRVRNGEESCDDLIRDYIPLLKKEANRIYVKGMDFEDKVNCLAFVFYKSIFKFDETRGFKFLTMTITDMRFRLLRENEAANSYERGGRATLISSDVPLCPEDVEKYTEIMKTGDEINDYLISSEIMKIVETVSKEWDALLKDMIIDYLLTGDKISEVKRRHNAEHVTYQVFKTRLRLLKKELQKQGYELHI